MILDFFSDFRDTITITHPELALVSSAFLDPASIQISKLYPTVPLRHFFHNKKSLELLITIIRVEYGFLRMRRKI